MSSYTREQILENRAQQLIDAKDGLISELIKIRKTRNLSLETVAERCSWPVSKAQEFEAYWYNPTTSEVTMYAQAVGAMISYTVTMDPLEDSITD